jgi:hypothetical protein
MPPLTELDWGAEGAATEELLNGQVPESLMSNNKYVNAVLHHIAQRRQLPEIDTYLMPEEVSRGFCCWKESTSTSPLGCHLGLCRIPSIPSDDKTTEKLRAKIQALQSQIINIPVHNGFSPERWQTVINTMLEKIPGKPYYTNYMLSIF